MKGRIIVIEGTDCSGKETQTSLLVQHLKNDGRKVERISFPMYDSPTGKIIGGSYLGKSYIGDSLFTEGAINVDPKVAALYYAADRSYNKEVILKLINDGYDVVIDRYVESNMAHQGAKLFEKKDRYELYQWLYTLEYDLLELPKPDLTIFLHMPYKKVLELKKGRTEVDQHEISSFYLKNAENTYLELASIHNYKTIKCTDKIDKLRDIEDIQNEIYNIVLNSIGE